jgi:chromosome segregation ATPase
MSKKSGETMSRTGITFKEVKEAIAELQGKQRNPTVDSIREILGTGSKSTIARFLREWKTEQGLHNGDEGQLPSDLQALVNGLWDALCNKSDTQANAYRQDCDIKVVEMQKHLAQSQQQNMALQARIHQLEEMLHQQTECSSQLQNKLILEQQDNATLTERAASLESHRQEQQTEIERMHQLVKHLQNNLEHYQTATQQLRQEQTLLQEKQRSEYEQKITQFQSQVTSVTTEKFYLQAQMEQLTCAQEKLQADYQALNQLHHDAQIQQQSVAIAHHALQQEHERLVEQHQKLSEHFDAKNQAVIELQIQLKNNNEKIAALESALSKADDKIQTLRHDYHFVSQEKANLAGQLKQLQQQVVKSTLVTEKLGD